MPNCSFCNANLEAIDVDSGLCPVCGKSLTIRDTVEFDEPHDNADDASQPDQVVGSDTVDLSSDEYSIAAAADSDGDDSVDRTMELSEADAADVADESLQTLPMDQADAVDADDESESMATVAMDEGVTAPAEGDAGDTVEMREDEGGIVESFNADDEEESLATVQMDDEQESVETVELDDDGEHASDDSQATMQFGSVEGEDFGAGDADGEGEDEESEDAIATMDIDADEDDDSLATFPLDADDDETGSGDSSDESLATMIVEIPDGKREGLVEEEFAADASPADDSAELSNEGAPLDSIDESEQMATMPMDAGAAEQDMAGGDSIDVAENAETYVMGPDDEATDDLVAQTFGNREGSGDQSTQQTIVSDDFSEHDSYQQTVMSDELPEEVLQTMKAAWVSADQPDAKPGMTVKAEDLEEFKKAAEDLAPETSLVIQLRRLVEADQQGTPEAEYELVKVLGEGGMGVVYLARQTSIDRSVAIKMLKPKTAQDTDQRLKFLAEAVVTGDLDHPNIVPIYDVGSNDSGALFYSMKRVEGTPWLDVIKEKTLEENLDILDSVANAVSFAHARGVVHRDLKPENVMLGGYGEVLLMDWGLAQPTKEFSKKGSIAETRSMGGTPAYMAPEMATGPLHKIGPHSDVYLLGAILFEVVTGKPPHRGANAMKCLMAAAKNQIRPVEETGELMDIAMKAMATNIEERHATVKELQDDIKEYLSHSESIDLSDRADKELKEAEESDVYQDYARSLFGFQEAYALWNGNTRAKEGISETRLAYAGSAMRKGDFDLGASLLDVDNPDHVELRAQLVKGKQEVENRVRTLKLAKRAGFVAAAVFAIVLIGGGIWINAERIKADKSAELAKTEAAKALKQEKIANEKTKEAVEAEKKATSAAELARTEGERAKTEAARAVEQEGLATVAADRAKTEAARAVEQEGKAREAAGEARQQTAIAEYRGYISTIGLAKAKIDENAFDAARTLLEQYIPEDGEADLRNWEWGRLMYLCSQAEKEFKASGNVLDIDVSADGTRLVTALEGGFVEVWDLVKAEGTNEKPVLRFSVGGGSVNVNAVAFSPGGTTVAVGTSSTRENVSLWDVSQAEAPAGPLKVFGDAAATNRFAAEHTAAVLSVQFSPDGSQLLTGSEDFTARVWDVAQGKQLAALRGHNWWVWDAAFSPDGRQIVTAGQDGIAIVWTYDSKDAAPPWTVAANIQQGPPFTGHTGPVYAAAFSPDGKEVVTGGYDRNVLIWKPEEVQPYRWENLQALATTTGRLGPQQRVAPAARSRRLEGHIASVRAVRFFRKEASGDAAGGPYSAGADNTAGNLLVLSSGDDGTVKVWNAATGTAIKTFRGHGSWVRTCAFAPNGQSVLSGSGDSTAREWRISEYAEIRELTGREFSGHSNAVLSASFSSNNRNVVTASEDRTAKTWTDDGREIRTFREGHEYLTSNATFFPDGKRMLTAAVDNTVRIWNVARGTEVQRLEHTGRSAAVALSPDGRWILTGSDRRPRGFELKPDGGWARSDNDGRSDEEIALWSAKLWNTETGELVREILVTDMNDQTHTSEVTAVAFSPDGSKFVTADGKGYGHLWRLEADAEGKATVSKLHQLKGHTWGQRIVAARFVPDGKRILTASTDGTVSQWDTETGRQLENLLLTHGDSLTAMDVASDGKRTLVLTSCADLSVRLWNADSAKEIGRLAATGGVAALSRNVADRLKQMNLEPMDVWTKTDLTKEQVSRILNPNSRSKPAGFDKTVQALAEFLKVQPNRLLKPYITSVAMSADGRQALTANSEDSIVRLWDVGQLKEIQIGEGPNRERSFLDARRIAAVEAAVFSPQDEAAKKDRFILTVGGANAQLWDVDTGREQIRYSPHASVSSAGYSPDGRFIVTAGLDNSARIWDAETGKTVVKLTGHTLDVNSALFSPDGKMVLTSSRDKTARLWDIASGEELKRLAGHEGAIGQAVFSDDGKLVATASDDGTARIWSVATGEELVRMDCRGGAVLCVAFSRDGRRVITGTATADEQSKAYARIWSIEPQPAGGLQAKEILYLTGHTAAVTSVAFSPDKEGSRALTGSEDYIVKLWDMRTTEDITRLAAEALPVDQEAPVEAPVPGEQAVPKVAAGDVPQVGGPEAAKEILSLAGHQREVTSVAFSHDGREVLTGSRDGKAILWLTTNWTNNEDFAVTERGVGGLRRRIAE